MHRQGRQQRGIDVGGRHPLNEGQIVLLGARPGLGLGTCGRRRAGSGACRGDHALNLAGLGALGASRAKREHERTTASLELIGRRGVGREVDHEPHAALVMRDPHPSHQRIDHLHELDLGLLPTVPEYVDDDPPRIRHRIVGHLGGLSTDVDRDRGPVGAAVDRHSRHREWARHRPGGGRHLGITGRADRKVTLLGEGEGRHVERVGVAARRTGLVHQAAEAVALADRNLGRILLILDDVRGQEDQEVDLALVARLILEQVPEHRDVGEVGHLAFARVDRIGDQAPITTVCPSLTLMVVLALRTVVVGPTSLASSCGFGTSADTSSKMSPGAPCEPSEICGVMRNVMPTSRALDRG